MQEWRAAWLASATLAIVASATPAASETAADFFAGKTITLIAPSAVGGGYDLYSRFL